MGADPKNVEARAEGRPPEESGSENPEVQAEAILAESEQRLEKGAAKAADGRAPGDRAGADG